MRLSIPLIAFVLALTIVSPLTADAAIIVGEFRWDVTVSDACAADVDPLTDPDCALSLFVLTNLWDGPAPEPTLEGELTIDAGLPIAWSPLSFTGANEQIPTAGVPGTASASVSFLFAGVQRTLGAVLTAGDLVATGDAFIPYSAARVLAIEAETVPEPVAVLLLTPAAIVAARRRRIRR